jgi:hypothetical protein
VRISIIGFNLPGSVFCRPDGSVMKYMHVGVQHGRDPVALVRADAVDARWEIDVDVVERDEQIDFRGPAVQGRRGDRFIYLTWGDVRAGHEFEMFRRAKVMLNRIDPDALDAGRAASSIAARIDLTGDDGGPRCARVDPPAIAWSVLPGHDTASS